MAKAKRQSKSPAKATPASDALRKLAADVGKAGDALRKFAADLPRDARKIAADLGKLTPAMGPLPKQDLDKWKEFAERPNHLQETAEQQRKWGERIDRYIAIRDNQIPPLWLPQPAAAPVTPLKTKDWLVQQKLGDIDVLRGITAFAGKLHARMVKDAQAGVVDRALAARTIEQWLRELKLFPKKQR